MNQEHKKISRYYFEESSGVISGDPTISIKAPLRATEVIVQEVNETGEPIDT